MPAVPLAVSRPQTAFNFPTNCSYRNWSGPAPGPSGTSAPRAALRDRSGGRPAGTFKTWKAEVSSAEGEPGTMTLWVAQDSRRVVKVGATLPEMGGAVLGAELQP